MWKLLFQTNVSTFDLNDCKNLSLGWKWNSFQCLMFFPLLDLSCCFLHCHDENYRWIKRAIWGCQRLSRLILASNKHGNNTVSIFLSGHTLLFSHFLHHIVQFPPNKQRLKWPHKHCRNFTHNGSECVHVCVHGCMCTAVFGGSRWIYSHGGDKWELKLCCTIIRRVKGKCVKTGNMHPPVTPARHGRSSRRPLLRR